MSATGEKSRRGGSRNAASNDDHVCIHIRPLLERELWAGFARVVLEAISSPEKEHTRSVTMFTHITVAAVGLSIASLSMAGRHSGPAIAEDSVTISMVNNGYQPGR